MSWLTLIALLLVPYTYEILGIIFLKSGVSVWEKLSLYQWAATGFIIYCIINTNALKEAFSLGASI